MVKDKNISKTMLLVSIFIIMSLCLYIIYDCIVLDKKTNNIVTSEVKSDAERYSNFVNNLKKS